MHWYVTQLLDKGKHVIIFNDVTTASENPREWDLILTQKRGLSQITRKGMTE